MTPSPALAAVFGDVLLCLGAGLMLGALRDAAGLALGDGRGRCFCWDVLTFILAAFVLCGFAAGASSSGVVRWYMAAGMLAGALGWRFSAAEAVRRSVWRLVAAAAWPFAAVSRHVTAPLAARFRQTAGNRAEKMRKTPKNSKKQLQNPTRILYN